MNESELRELWSKEKPLYKVWGEFIVDDIKGSLTKAGKDLSTFLKVPAKYRIKDTDSLIDKAFHQPNKSYTNPYYQIEDKVGARFVVLLLSDIEEICDIIKNSNAWLAEPSKHFQEDRDKDPLLFTYQSVHYILKPQDSRVIKATHITPDIVCEVQIRTLLQHAHAELTHDAIYKSQRIAEPRVLRTIAKSMALIETTDDFFTETTELLNSGSFQEKDVKQLDAVYMDLTGLKPNNLKSSLAIWDVFDQFLDRKLISNIQKMVSGNPAIKDAILTQHATNTFYAQSTILYVYWLLLNKKQRLLRDWPLDKNILKPLAVDLGISIRDDQ